MNLQGVARRPRKRAGTMATEIKEQRRLLTPQTRFFVHVSAFKRLLSLDIWKPISKYQLDLHKIKAVRERKESYLHLPPKMITEAQCQSSSAPDPAAIFVSSVEDWITATD